MNKGVLIGIIVVILAAGGIYMAMNGKDASDSSHEPVTNPNMPDGNSAPMETTNPGAQDSDVSAGVSAGVDVSVPSGTVKEFNITGSSFAFSQKEIRVKKGDTVKINFTNTEGMHDWKIDEFNATTKIIKAGETDSVQFVADKAGTFEYYCSVGSHRQMGMKGNLIVE